MFRHFAWEREVMAVELETAEMICEPNSEKTWSNAEFTSVGLL